MTVLFINRSDSRCGKCDRNADPVEKYHRMGRMVGEGCGVRFTSLSSHYSGDGIERAARAMRPDLPWVDFDAIATREADPEQDTPQLVPDEQVPF